MIPVDEALRCEAPPGYILVERDDLQARISGLILLSEDYKKFTKGALATVQSVGLFAGEDYQIGDKVLLAPQAGKRIEFGWNAERTFWRVSPSQILAKLKDGDAMVEGSSPFAAMRDKDFDMHVERGRDEGDVQGLR